VINYSNRTSKYFYYILFLNIPTMHPIIKTCAICLVGGGGLSCVGFIGATVPHLMPLPDWTIIKSAQLSTHGFTYQHGLTKFNFDIVAGQHPQLLKEIHKVCYTGTKILSPELLREYNITESAKLTRAILKEVIQGPNTPIPAVVDTEFFEKEQARLRDLQAALDGDIDRIQNAKDKFESERAFKK
jgi:hypothetical protein